MPENRDRLVEDLSERLRTALDSGDPTGLLDATTLFLARDLAQALPEDSLDTGAADVIEALSVLVAVHWARYQLLPEEQDHDDLQACLQWSAALLPVAFHLVPEPVRAHLAGPAVPVGDTAAEATARGAALYESYERTGNIELLQTAITLFREAVDATPVGHPTQPAMLYLGAMLQIRFERTGQLADLDQAITLLGDAADAAPDGHPTRPAALSGLGNSLLARFRYSGRLADLDQAIAAGQEAVDATRADHLDRLGVLANLGAALQTRFQYSGRLPDLDQAITLAREAVDAAPADDPARPTVMFNLGAALHTRSELTGEQADLDQAITLFREAVGAAAVGHLDRPSRLSNLGNALRNRFFRTGRLVDLDEAITFLREAVDAAPVGHLERPRHLSNLGAALEARFGRTGQPADLDQAIILSREAVDAAPVGHTDRPKMLSNLGNALQARFGHTGHLVDLDEAITTGGEAVDATSADHLDQPEYLSNLADALRTRFGRTGQLADLDQAIILSREAVDAAPVGHPERPRYLSILGAALEALFGRTGQQEDLDQAVIADREAADATQSGHPDRDKYLTVLGKALRTRFERTGQLADLDQAITLSQEAVDAAPVGHPGRPGYLSNLGSVLQARFDRTGEQADLDQAIAAGQDAVDATPLGHPAPPGALSNLGAALGSRFEHTGQQADLDQAIILYREAVKRNPAGHPDRPMYLSNLGGALRARFDRAGQQGDLDEAITLFHEAVAATPVGHPNRSLYLSNLGGALQRRFGRTGHQMDLDRALEAFREGAEVVTASPALRVAAARGWGQCGLLAGDPGDAVAGYAAAIGLLPLVAWHGLNQATREHHLRECAGLASDAAAAAVAAGDPARAVELLEAGRSMLWTQALHLRQDLAALQERAPDLAAVLEASRAVLNGSPIGLIRFRDEADVERGPADELRMLEERRRAARDWDAAVDQIRQIEGFEHFLRPVPFTDLRAAASGGPVVVVNVSRDGSQALILSPTTGPDPGPEFLVIDLPDAPKGTVIDQASVLLGAVRRAGDPARGWEAREADRHAVFGVLAWCWQAITAPVLAALGHACTPGGRVEDWPRVWWCPTGPAAVLPLHAAGRHPRTATQYQAMGEAAAVADTVAGRVISSYTPTLAALIRARARPAPDRVRLLAVGVAEAPPYVPAGPLPAVPAELQVLASYLPLPRQATQVLGPAATRQAVLDALPSHGWLHLSCHGVQHPADAALSAFLLYDQPLTLADLAALDLRDTDLACLSACQTAAGDLRLLDEALHLAGALQLTGYRHVLATLWSISDAAAPHMADITYAHLLHPDPENLGSGDQPQAYRAPHALHHAVTRLRQTVPGEPLLWAPYIYLGP